MTVLQQRIIGNAVRLITVLVQCSHYIVSVTKVSCFSCECFAMRALPKKVVLMPVFWKYVWGTWWLFLKTALNTESSSLPWLDDLHAQLNYICDVLWRLCESWRGHGERNGVWRSDCTSALWCDWISTSSLSMASQRTTVTYWRLQTLRGQNNRLGIAVSLLCFISIYE